MRRAALLLLPLFAIAIVPPSIARAQGHKGGPVLHEPIPPDPREDVALSVSLDGDLPAAINTPRGLVSAPDPARPIGQGDSPYSPLPKNNVPDASFQPDRDTHRPDVLPYDDPFVPSTAPFKRLSAFDAVDASYTLSVRDPHMVQLPVSPGASDATEEHFFADMVVDLSPNVRVRIPSVGPGSRVLRARAGVGLQDVPIRLFKDGAENWFVEAQTKAKARLVMEVSAPRAAFGGDFGNPTWAELMPVAPLPPNVVRAATEVSAKLGVGRRLSPRDNVTKLVSYFRSFAESDEAPAATRDIYLDLALSKKGVCRHRSFAFMVTALALGIPTRVVVNEAHAWVEVHDGRLWRRIDLGGAGRTLHDPLSQNVPYEPPADPFAWPQGATRGDDLADRARTAPPPPTGSAAGARDGGAPSPAGSGSGSANGTSGGASGANGGGASSGGAGGASGGASTATGTPDERPPSTITLSVAAPDAHRGAPLKIRGTVAAEGEPCGHVSVSIVLSSRAQGELPVGVLATDERGTYDGALVLPASVPLGDYEVAARTFGDARCGRGATK